MAADYTLSVHGEFKDDITKELGGVSGVVAGFKENLKSAAQGALSFGDVLKANILSDAIMSGLGKLKDGLVSIGKAAYEEGAALEQSLGGVETLFKDHADTVKKYANEAYKTAGLSANEYMESVTGFSASLLQSLGGDTEKAAEAANQAIIDMSDNANKMGTSMESIQTAYAGFAKQNYTMLDNLKLGYGGTKEEMQRLLEDAEKISGVHYDISNLSDVYSAIHVIQTELDITGTTAKEASQTLAGSFAAMGSAWKNVLGKLTIGESIKDELGELHDSVLTFADNLLPAVGNMLDGLPDMVDGAVSVVSDLVPKIGEMVSQHGGQLLEAGKRLITGIIDGITTNAPALLEGAVSIVAGLGESILGSAPQLLETGRTLLTNILTGITASFPDILDTASNFITEFYTGLYDGLPEMMQSGSDLVGSIMDGVIGAVGQIWDTGKQVVSTIAQTITDNLPEILETGVSILSNIINGILEHIPDLISAAGEVLAGFTDFIGENLPTIMQAGADLLVNLVQGIVDNLPEIAEAVIEVIKNFNMAVVEHLPEIAQKGVEIIGELIAGLIKAIPDLIAAIPQITTKMMEEFLNVDWIGLGGDILAGIGKGLLNFGGSIVGACKDAGDNILGQFADFFGIHSPSRLMADSIGKYIPEGIAVGIEANTGALDKTMGRLDSMVLRSTADITANTNAAGYRGTSNTNTYNYGGFNLSVYGAEGQDEEALADIIEQRIRYRMQQEEAVFA